MKQATIRVIAAAMAVVLAASAIAGCGDRNGDEPSSVFEAPEFIFVPEYVSLPDSITDISNLCVIGERLYFSSQIMDEETYTFTTKLFSMNIDGSNLSELANYSHAEPPDGAEGNVYIQSMISDGEGSLWVIESGNFYGFDLPDDFDEETDETWMYYYDMGSITSVRKLDTNGRETLSVDISALADEMEYFYIRTFSIDMDSNIYLAGADSSIYVLDNGGRLRFTLDVANWVDQLIRMADGSVAFFGYTETGRVLRKIDFASRDWGEDVALPYNAYSIFPGGGDYDFLFSDNTSLYGLESDTGENISLLNWINSGVSDGLGNIAILPDGRILGTSYSWDNITGSASYELIILTRVPYDSIPERTVLTLAAMWLDWNLRSAIVQFNRTNANYRIHVTDYSEFNTEDDWQAGLTRLSTEIIAGNVPDILFTSNLPFNQYVARGLIEDIYPYIDADPGLSRSDFIAGALQASEINGSLYLVFPSFNVSTLLGSPSVLGSGMGWNMEEFNSVMRANPDATIPMGQGMTKSYFLQYSLMMGMDEYVDWSAGRCSFDSGEFADLLEFANTFPEEYNWEGIDWVSEDELIASGRQIMKMAWVSDFMTVQMDAVRFGGEIVFKGFPTRGRDGNVLSHNGGIAMTTRCSDKQGAWEFMRTILTEDWQRANIRWNFPTNSVVFNELLLEAMTPEYYTDEDGNEVEAPKMSFYTDYAAAVPAPARGSVGSASRIMMPDMPGMVNIYALSQAEADLILALIDSMSGVASYDEALMEIILEGAADYFSGRSSKQDAARVIQSRASIYVAEQS